jgi:hypothetical protein
MLKWSQTRLLVTLALSYLVFAEVVSLFLSDGSTCIVNPAAYGQYYADNNECPALHVFLIKIAASVLEKLGDPNWVIAIAAVVTAAFTIILGLFTISLSKSTRIAANAAGRSVKVAEDSLVKLERAFVFSDSFEISNIRDPTTDRTLAWQFQMKWQNTGSTPARHVLLHTSWENFPGDIPGDFDFPDHGNIIPAPSYIPPHSHILSVPAGIDVSVIYGVSQGHFRLFFWGWATYDDIFENTPHHLTRFCWELVQVSRDPYLPDGQNTRFRFDVHPRWNCIDEDCT